MVVNEFPLNMLSCVSCFTQRRKDGGGPGLLQLKGLLREGAALFVEKSGSGFFFKKKIRCFSRSAPFLRNPSRTLLVAVCCVLFPSSEALVQPPASQRA